MLLLMLMKLELKKTEVYLIMNNYKKVNIQPIMPIFTVYPAITQKQEGIILPIGKIERCIIARAKVEEVLPNGETILLNLGNYKNDFSITEQKKEETIVVKEEIVVNEEVKSEVIPEIERDNKVEESDMELSSGEDSDKSTINMVESKENTMEETKEEIKNNTKNNYNKKKK